MSCGFWVDELSWGVWNPRVRSGIFSWELEDADSLFKGGAYGIPWEFFGKRLHLVLCILLVNLSCALYTSWELKYGQEDLGWRTKKANGAFGVGVWKEILKESVWCTVLSQRFLHLYAMAVHKNATVDEMWDQNFGQGSWNLRFLRDFNDWELNMVDNLLLVLRGHRITLEEDSVF
ncbi:hypothetical protein CK203_002334 [Vitis vinifera]|uniref:Uncharacterized protein n=1 Tax=Vitis vinifera TaxID=29760 RepID=A0A438KK39_VITVI|nr:hypothetical protein CK203_002334 [Vitis vinifera]